MLAFEVVAQALLGLELPVFAYDAVKALVLRGIGFAVFRSSALHGGWVDGLLDCMPEVCELCGMEEAHMGSLHTRMV